MLGLQLPRHSESCEGNAGRIMLPDKSYLFAGIAPPKSPGGQSGLGVKRYLLSAVFAAETKVTCLRGSPLPKAQVVDCAQA